MLNSTNRRIRAGLIVLSIGGIIALTGCSSGSYENDGSTITNGAENGASTAPYEHYTFWQKLPDGKRVLCVVADDNSNSLGLSCDWEHVASASN